MNILRLDGWDGPTIGGAQVYIRRVSAALDARGHRNVTAAIVTEPVPEAGERLRTFTVPRSPARQAVAGFSDSAALTRWLDAVATDVRPDLIHLHRFHAGFPALGPWLAGRREPIVFTAHDTELVCPVATLTLPDGTSCPGGILPRCQFTGCEVGVGLPLNLAKRHYFDTYVRDRVRSFIFTSRATQGIFENLGYRPTDLLRPMIPVPERPATEPPFPLTIGFLGRFERQKGIDVLLAAFEIVRRSRPDARLRFAGSGPAAIPTRDAVTVDGWVTDVHRWFDGIHLLVVPSLPWENLGNSAVEALGHGVPVVVSDTGGLPEAVGKFGIAVPPGSAEGLAAAILRQAEQYPAARALAREGRAWVREEYSTDRHLEHLLAIYGAARGSPTAA
ncbi:MAG: glycosyltransferase family 4 protein [Thermoplasmata archaeon]